jgi:hypothetical protein
MSSAHPSLPWAGRLPACLKVVLLLATVLVLLSGMAILLAHLGDTYQISHVSGVWIGLAEYLNHGILYPALYEDGRFGGTRYMPLYFTLHAGLARLTGEYLLSGKLLSLLLTLACGGLVLVTLRRFHCAWTIALALTTLALFSSSGYLAATTIYGDLLPVVCQLAALLVVQRSRSPAAAMLAGLLCALAVLSKLTAGWAALAILAATFRRDRKFLALFLTAWLVSLSAAFVGVYVLSAGRLVSYFLVISDPGFPGRLANAPIRLLRAATSTCPVLLILMPLALLELGLAVGQRRLNVYHTSFFFCVLILVVVFTDRGVDANHLVDLAVLMSILTGLLWAAQTEAPTEQVGLRAVLVLAMLWALAAVEVRTLGYPIRDLFRGRNTAPYPNKPLADVIDDQAVILTEHPLVDVSRGRLPVVLDPYALVYIEKKHPEWVAELAGRIQRKEFAYIVLQFRLDLDPNVFDGWYKIEFGPTVAGAIREHYRFLVERDGFCVLVPR